MEQVKLIRLFISCPNDIREEINSLKIIIEEINKTVGRQNNYYIESLNWEDDTYSGIGSDVQDVINNQIDSKYDILVALLWQRIGSPTKREKSGTVEEINRAIKQNKNFLIYFNIAPPGNLKDIDVEQLTNINSFKKDLGERGILYKEYESVPKFESLFRINIINLIGEKLLAKKQFDALAISPIKNKYSAIESLINEVEQKENLDSIEIDVFELIENMYSALTSVTSSLSAMGVITNDVTNNLNKRTDELIKYTSLKDPRLRLTKGEIVVNLMADELNNYSSRMNEELPRFSENFLQIAPMYTSLMQYQKYYHEDDILSLRNSISEYRDAIETLTNQTASVLISIQKWPPNTSKLNKAKRETEIILKNITKELLEGLKLLDEAVVF